ncbi:MAG: prepilin-type N-terminal cleavage/methylation domain-containing protein [Pirellulaceae bacterium]|nr:prepilin-type N-terminal cleavage/methylation domain-containing protein [Pirellulaceae bacterium]
MSIRKRIRRAFTLIEMLIAMALTLILVYAIAEFYAYVGDIVKDGRAMIAVASELRGVTQRLTSDLDIVTEGGDPWIEDLRGYIEYREGAGSDLDTIGNGQLNISEDLDGDGNLDGAEDANGNGVLDSGEDADGDGKLDVNEDFNGNGSLDVGLDLNGNGINDFVENNVSTTTGDIDDVLCFTIRSTFEPLVAHGFDVDTSGLPMLTPGSQDPLSLPPAPPWYGYTAEVAWWTSFEDLNGNNLWDLGEVRTLHRRQLVIRPDLNVVHGNDSNYTLPYFFRIPIAGLVPGNPTAGTIYESLQYCDVSLRFDGVRNGYMYFMANSLDDLRTRQNRFLHWTPFPSPIDIASGALLVNAAQPLTDVSNNGSMNRWVLHGFRKGEDVLLSNVLAFDVRAYDPYAPIYADHATNARSTVQPGDLGWYRASQSNPLVGRGAFVDLFYTRNTPLQDNTLSADTNWLSYSAPGTDDLSYFSAAPHARSFGLPSTWTTWPAIYERDGVDQDGPLGADQGTNGIDDDGANGVDDVGERETSPPYPYPLRGIEVRIRVYEPGTRQVRQATVGADFLAE